MSTKSARTRLARSAVLVAGVVVTGLLVSSCGSDTATEATTAPRPDGIGSTDDAGNDAGFRLDVELPTQQFQLELPAEAIEKALGRPGSQPGTTHPLERIIDLKPPEEQSSFDWDQEAALACAHVEFALDAVIAEDREALDQTLGEAADWARQSGATELSEFVQALQSTPDLVEAETLVFDILGRCTEAGYEL